MQKLALIALILGAPWPTTASAQAGAEGPTGEADGDGDADADVSVDVDGLGDAEGDTDVGDGDGDGEGLRDGIRLPHDSPPPRSADAAPVKVAVVTVGDPDDALRARARDVDMLLARQQGLTVPTDSGLRRALRGDPEPGEDDGLSRVRRGRRALGMDDADDAGGLAALGRVSGAVAVVALKRRAGSIFATVLDVASARLYEGDLDVGSADEDAIARFVRPRAEASARRASERDAQAASEGSWRDAAGRRDGHQADNRQTDESGTEVDEGDDDEPGFFAKYWPYMVAALLLGGALIYAFTVDTTPDTPSPVLRFIPGGN